MSSVGNAARRFVEGTVFGFDVGTGSIGYSVRQGNQFLDVGVLICDSEGSDLSKRRELRRQRRTLRSRKARRDWFANELTKIGLPKPDQPAIDPISLRVRAINGDALDPKELHSALSHLFRRCGYSTVPWAKGEDRKNKNDGSKEDDDEGVIKSAVEGIRQEMHDKDCNFPCELLAVRRCESGLSPTKKWARKIYWPRELLKKEFLAIAAAQKDPHPALSEKANWLLYGDTRKVKDFHVYFKSSESRNPGVLGMKWPRFDNRGPALDSLQPVDDMGRPLHVVRKDKTAFVRAQWELALMNFRVLDAATRQKIDPRKCFPEFIEALRAEWLKKGSVTIARLKKLALPFSEKFLLIEDQKPLSPDTGSGRARYASPTLDTIRTEIQAGRQVDPPQPILKRKGETLEDALNRYLADIKHPLVRHRLGLFRRLLAKLQTDHGSPDLIVVEAVRSLALGQRKKAEMNKRNEQHRKDREIARGDLVAAGKSISRKAITRYRLWKEAQSTCPFCCEKISQSQILNGDADIEHLVPRSIVDCSELYNLTIGHIHCNREVKGNKTPFAAFSSDRAKWEQLQAGAKKCFKGRKLEIFLSPNAEELIERATDLQHTAYIARVIRSVALLQLGWIGKDGRDPTIEKGNTASTSFHVTNGQLTSRLRGAWGLNQLLHPLPPQTKWEDLTEEEKSRYSEKNRGDLRHHALDAMVISCTLPWLAHRAVGALDPGTGEHGWWVLDEKTQRSMALNPVFPATGEMRRVCKDEIEKVVPRHHVSRSKHQRAYDTTIYGQPRKTVFEEGRKLRVPIANCYVSRELLTALKPKDLKSGKGKSKVFPALLGDYLALVHRP